MAYRKHKLLAMAMVITLLVVLSLLLFLHPWDLCDGGKTKNIAGLCPRSWHRASEALRVSGVIEASLLY